MPSPWFASLVEGCVDPPVGFDQVEQDQTRIEMDNCSCWISPFYTTFQSSCSGQADLLVLLLTLEEMPYADYYHSKLSLIKIHIGIEYSDTTYVINRLLSCRLLHFRSKITSIHVCLLTLLLNALSFLLRITLPFSCIVEQI